MFQLPYYAEVPLAVRLVNRDEIKSLFPNCPAKYDLRLYSYLDDFFCD